MACKVYEKWGRLPILIARLLTRSAMGTLVERSSRFVMLARMEGTDADAALDGFTQRLRSLPKPVLQTLTHDQGKEMARHEALERKSASASPLPTPTVPGSVRPTRTPMGSCVSISPKGRICRDIRNGT